MRENTQYKVEDGTKKLIGDVVENRFLRGGKPVASLNVRTPGFGPSALSPYTNLDSTVKQIEKEAADNPNKNAYLVVNAAGFYQKWNIKIEWL